MGSLCKMTTAAAAVVVVVFAALVASVGFPVFLKKGGREERQCYAAGELAQLGQKSPTWLGRRRAAKSQGRHYMYGVRARARAPANEDSESNFRAALHRSSRCPLHCHDGREGGSQSANAVHIKRYNFNPLFGRSKLPSALPTLILLTSPGGAPLTLNRCRAR